VKSRYGLLLLVGVAAIRPALAADAENGKRIAMSRCAACHMIDTNRTGLAVGSESPPFEIVASKFRSNPGGLVSFILAPHARMNMTISPREAADVAEYILTLAK
jgi:mono/diheme cytochrome c family protein